MLKHTWLRFLVVLTVLAVMAAQGQLVAFANHGSSRGPDQGVGVGQGIGNGGQGNGNSQSRGNADGKDDKDKNDHPGNGRGNANGNGNSQGNGNDDKGNGRESKHENSGNRQGNGQGNTNAPQLTPGLENNATSETPTTGGGGPGKSPALRPGKANENRSPLAGLLPDPPARPRGENAALSVPPAAQRLIEGPGLAGLMRGAPTVNEERPNTPQQPSNEAVVASILTPVTLEGMPDTREEVSAGAPSPREQAPKPAMERHVVSSGFSPMLFSGFDESLFTPAAVESSPTPLSANMSGRAAARVVMAAIVEEARSYAGFAPAQFSGLDEGVLEELAQGKQQEQPQPLPQPDGEADDGAGDEPPAQAQIVTLAREREAFAGFDPGFFGGFSLDLLLQQVGAEHKRGAAF